MEKDIVSKTPYHFSFIKKHTKFVLKNIAEFEYFFNLCYVKTNSTYVSKTFFLFACVPSSVSQFMPYEHNLLFYSPDQTQKLVTRVYSFTILQTYMFFQKKYSVVKS